MFREFVLIDVICFLKYVIEGVCIVLSFVMIVLGVKRMVL